MKILRIAPDIYPNMVGGFGIHVHEMSKEQVKLGHEVTVYISSDDIKHEYQTADGYYIRNFKPLAKILGNSIMPAMLFDLLKEQSNYDVVHAHSHLFFSTNLTAVARQFGSTPLIITNHGLNSQTAPRWIQNIYTATGARLTFAAADKILCYTETEKKELVDLGIKSKKIEVVHNGIDTDLFVPARELSFNKKNLLWIGRYVNGKGVDYLIDAVSILKKEHPDVTLTMIGKGPIKDRISLKIRNLDLENNIIMKDFVPNSETVSLYQSSSVFVLPSLEEGVPRTILEAMSCGVPVVCSSLPQLVDIVNGCGLLTPVKDSQALADNISKILSNSSLAQEFSKNGRKKVVENHSWKDTVKKTIHIYKELV